jgi:hypothetical protein
MNELNYSIWKRTPSSDRKGGWTYSEPYLYATASNDELSHLICKIALQINPHCLVWTTQGTSKNNPATSKACEWYWRIHLEKNTS